MHLSRSALLVSVSTSALIAFAFPALSEQVTMKFDVCGDAQCDVNSYIGAGAHGGSAGAAREAMGSNPGEVNDAYDDFGLIWGAQAITGTTIVPYASEFNGLSAWRQTESYEAVNELAPNSIRWFDSFTNDTGSAISADIVFGGNLGSDMATEILASGQGYFVTGQGNPGNQSSDPVIAHIYGNNDFAFNTATYTVIGDQVRIVFPITVAPGQTVSLMNVNILTGDVQRMSDPDGAFYDQDALLAAQNAELFINNPIFAGLTAAQIQTLANWNVRIDGSLPAAGSVAAAGQVSRQVMGNVLNSRSLANPQLNSSPKSGESSVMGYAPIGPQSDAALAAADAGSVNTEVVHSTRVYTFGEYSGGNQSFSAGSFGYDAYTFGGGLEHTFNSDLLGGVMVGVGRGSGSIASVYNGINNSQVTISPYASWRAPTDTVLDMAVFLSMMNSSYERVAGAGVANASMSGSGLGARAKVSQPVALGDVTLTPFAKADFWRSNVDGYTETGAGAANLMVPSYSVDSLDVQIGLNVSRVWKFDDGRELIGYGGVGLGKGLLGGTSITTQYASSATTFNSPVDVNNGAYVNLDAGLSFKFTQAFSANVGYGATIGENARQHTLSAGVTGRF